MPLTDPRDAVPHAHRVVHNASVHGLDRTLPSYTFDYTGKVCPEWVQPSKQNHVSIRDVSDC